MGIAPAFAIPKALKRAGLSPEDIDVWEVHEAYASVAVAILRELPNQLDGFEVPDERLNPNGGAVAIGHPFGSSGTRYVLTLATELRERKARYGVLGVCVGSGPGRRPRAREPAGRMSGTRTSKVERMPAVALSPLPPIGDRDHVAGSDSPDVTLVEYGDFGCPFCFAASVPVRGLLDRFDTLRLVWRHFPDAELHPGADLAAELSELAAVHGRFWEAHLLLLAGREKFTRDDLLSVANRLELEMDEAEPALRERTFRRARP